MWEAFATAMGGLAYPQAMSVAGLLNAGGPKPMKVLDVAASHGIFGIAAAQSNPQAVAVGLDWENVLPMARENARRFGVGDRYETIAGDVFKVDLGGPYDAILVPNLLHHFDVGQNVVMLKRLRAAAKPGGKIVIVEFVVEEDRITPPAAGAFAMIMLASTPHGDVYTFKEYSAMLAQAGFKNPELREIGHGIQVAVIGQA
jgi:ubiquinone/menaquinone biosynthesis C-methylase UbiE